MKAIINQIFAVVFIEGDSTYSNPCVRLSDLLYNNDNEENGYEWQYAVCENMTEIIGLKVGERVQMKFNRDNPDSDGFIKRIK